MSPINYCPGSRSVKDPVPEYFSCPQCGEEVEIWTHELMQPCPRCKTPVFRAQHPTCIDWCQYAKECVGPELYESLKPQAALEANSGPIAALSVDHEEAERRLGTLRGAALCLRAGGKAAPAQALETLEQVIHFFDHELRRHFLREEEGLFPVMERRISREGSPIAVLLNEHKQVWQEVAQLRERAGEWRSGGGDYLKVGADIYRVTTGLARLLHSHIERENTALLPLAQGLLGEAGLGEVAARWQALDVAAGSG